MDGTVIDTKHSPSPNNDSVQPEVNHKKEEDQKSDEKLLYCYIEGTDRSRYACYRTLQDVQDELRSTRVELESRWKKLRGTHNNRPWCDNCLNTPDSERRAACEFVFNGGGQFADYLRFIWFTQTVHAVLLRHTRGKIWEECDVELWSFKQSPQTFLDHAVDFGSADAQSK